MWHIDGYTFKGCTKRIKGYNFKEKAPRDNFCLFNEKVCGETTENNNFYCVP